MTSDETMQTSSKQYRISDPVHGYIALTYLESRVLNHRVAQRLRYISQNGLAHLVFPEARSSRFSHSLGTMHLASRFLAAVLRNTTVGTKAKLCEAIRDAVEKSLPRMVDVEAAA